LRKLEKIDFILGICFIVMVSALAVAVYWQDLKAPKQTIAFSADMSLRELAKKMVCLSRKSFTR